MSKKKQAAKRFAHETLDAGYQYKDLGDNTFALVDAKGKRYNVKDAGLEANKSGIANLFTPNRRQRILNARALARAAALKGATKAEPKAFYNPTQQQQQQQQQNQQTTGKGGSDGSNQEKVEGKLSPGRLDPGQRIKGKRPELIDNPDPNTLELTPTKSSSTKINLDWQKMPIKGSETPELIPFKTSAKVDNPYMFVGEEEADQYDPMQTQYVTKPYWPSWAKNYENVIDTTDPVEIGRLWYDSVGGKTKYEDWLFKVDPKTGRTNRELMITEPGRVKVMNEQLQQNYSNLSNPHYKFDRQFDAITAPWTRRDDWWKEQNFSDPNYRSPEGLVPVKNPNFQEGVFSGSTDPTVAEQRRTNITQQLRDNNMQGNLERTTEGDFKYIPTGSTKGMHIASNVGSFAPDVAKYLILRQAGGLGGSLGYVNNMGNIARYVGRASRNTRLGLPAPKQTPRLGLPAPQEPPLMLNAPSTAPTTPTMPNFNSSGFMNRIVGNESGGFAGQAARNISRGKFAPGFKNGGQLRYGK